MRPVTRATPVLPAHAMKTYEIARPLPTHFRIAACAQVQCRAWRNGWRTVIDVNQRAKGGKPSGADMAAMVYRSGRKFAATQGGSLMTFTFPPGQQCFTPHRVPVEREPLFVVRGGDWRGNPRQTPPRRLNARQFVDDFGEHQARLKERLQRG